MTKIGVFNLGPLCGVVVLACVAAAVAAPDRTDLGSGELKAYFERQVAALEGPLDGVESLEEWEEKRPEMRKQLLGMLGLDPMPERTELKAVVTGKIERGGVVVEKVHFQSSPGLYVTGNLYLPRQREGKVPAILYVCGHARAKVDGVSYGNKTSYQHHGIWFARNGYACLLIDTIQLGEIEGTHHGTYRHGRWWWNARGYTPAGVEAWNCVRALDYLQGRPEVDGERIGVTGRSGGGAYSWWIAAIDERVKVAVPVAGITSLRNHVVDGCIEGHCDCMFPVNTHRWDFEQVAALVAPRPLLISNTDKDRIFPIDGVYEVYRPVRRIYELHGAGGKLGLNVEEGPHKDTQPLRTSAFHWMNRHLKGAGLQDTFEMAAEKLFEPHELKVFAEVPGDEIVTRIDESFVAEAQPPVVPGTTEEWKRQAEGWMKLLRQMSFGGWPEGGKAKLEGPKVVTEEGVRCAIRIAPGSGSAPRAKLVLHVLGEGEEAPAGASGSGGAEAWFAPRGVTAGEWMDDAKKRTHIRRRFALVGQTQDAMRVWDIIQAVRALRSRGWESLEIRAGGVMAGNVLYASLFLDDPPERLVLTDLPVSHREGPIYLNVLKVLDMPQAVAMAAGRCRVSLVTDHPEAWAYPVGVAKKFGGEDRLVIQPRPVPTP